MDWEALAAAASDDRIATGAALEVVDITAPPFGEFLKQKKVDQYMRSRIDVAGHWLVMFTPNCEKKWGSSPSVCDLRAFFPAFIQCFWCVLIQSIFGHVSSPQCPHFRLLL